MSSKRPRSPSSPSSNDRASKRLTLITQDAYHPLGGHILTGVADPDWRMDDSWVVRTRGLTIHSPALDAGLSRFGLPNAQDVGSSLKGSAQDAQTQDIPMSIDEGEYRLQPPTTDQTLPFPPSIQVTTPVGFPHEPEPEFYLPSLDQALFDASRGQDLLNFGTRLPHIHVQSATPTPTSPSDHSRRELLMDSAFSPRKKPPVAMGPRAGCEKCRLRVPGHWMHFD